jgi:hypothetical protein
LSKQVKLNPKQSVNRRFQRFDASLLYGGNCVGGVRWMPVREDFWSSTLSVRCFLEAAEQTSNAQLPTPNAGSGEVSLYERSS